MQSNTLSNTLSTTLSDTPIMITGQMIESGKQLMAALAAVEQMGKREIAEIALRSAQENARELSAAGKSVTALYLLSLKLRMPEYRGLGLYLLAAMALDFGLEPDDTARREAEATLRDVLQSR